MVILTEIAEKLNKVLNGTDSETMAYTRPSDYQFSVATQGFHLDYIYDKTTGKNFIPVFIGAMGGQFNPIAGLEQADYTIPVTMYFPVRFKDDFYALNEFLVKCFVGAMLNWGTSSGKCVSNISVANFGEIQDLDLNEFKEWVGSTYRTTIDVMEAYMSMTFNLYLSTANSSYVFGNSATISLSINGTTYEDDDVKFLETSVQSQSSPQAEQLLGTSETQGLPMNTSYSSGFSVYVKDSEFYNYLIGQWFNGNAQNLVFTLSLAIGNNTFSRTCYLNSAMLSIRKGQLMTITFSFVKRIS